MAKLQCHVPEALAEVIGRVRNRVGNKGKALRALVELALESGNEYKDDERFGGGLLESCTLTISDSDWKATLDYRDRNKVYTKTDFFLHALKHGATLWV